MTCAIARLEADGVDSLVLSDATGWHVASVDLGSPTIRRVSQPRPDANGTFDTTRHHGDAAVTLQAMLRPTDRVVRRSMLDALKAFLRPDLRPYLYLSEDDTDPSERRIQLVADQWSNPITRNDLRQVQVSWRAPDGVLESADETVAVAHASGAGTEAGLSFTTPVDGAGDLVYNTDLTFPATTTIGAVTVVNDGTAVVQPTLRMFGDATGLRIENQTTGEELIFAAAFQVTAGQYLEVDTHDWTIRLNGDPTQNRYEKLEFASSSTTFTLPPGPSVIRFFPVSFTAPSLAEIRFRSQYLP